MGQVSCCSWILVAGTLQEPLFDTVLNFLHICIIFHIIDIIFDNHLQFDQMHHYHGYATKVALLAEWNDVQFNISDPGPIRHATLTYLIIMVVLSFFYIIFSILLLHGIKGDRRVYFIPWLIWSVAYMIVTATFTIHKVVAKASGGC